MKKYIILLISAIIISGCNTNQEPTLNRRKGGVFDCPSITEKIVNIKNIPPFPMSTEYLIMTKNKIYIFNGKKYYSNNETCKEISLENIEKEIDGISTPFDGKPFIYTKDNETYMYNDQKYVFEYDEYYKNDYLKSNAYQLKLLLKKDFKNIILSDERINFSNIYYPVSIDNRISLVNITKDKDYNFDGYKIKEVSGEIGKEENVVSVNSNYIKTNKSYYKINKTKSNKEECEKYADVKCKYKYILKKDEELTTNYDNILVANDIIIFNNMWYTNY